MLHTGVILSQQNRTLTIQRVKKEDSGRYTCTACNRQGCDTSQAVLTTEGQSLVHLVTKAKSSDHTLKYCRVQWCCILILLVAVMDYETMGFCANMLTLTLPYSFCIGC